MAKPYIHFSREEFSQRQQKTRIRLEELGLDGLLLFKIEDMYWLTGYESDGFCIFGCMFVGTDGALTHLARPADLGNISYSSICDDVRTSPDGDGQTRADHIQTMLQSHGMAGKKIGIQVDTMGLTPRLFLEIQTKLEGWCDLIIAPDFIRELRLVKSPRELTYFRKAGEIMDTVMDKVIDATHPGAFEGDIYATFYDTLFRLDADLPAHIPPFGSGESALNLRYTSGRKHVLENDQVTLELGLAYRHYHVACMGVVLTGPEVSDRHLRMHATSVAALEAVQQVLRPGRTVGELFDTYRSVLEDRGEHDAVLTVAGYTMGAMWPPTWMEQPLIFSGNSQVLEENMTFFTHMILNDRETGLSMAVGETAIVTNDTPEIITHAPRDPIIKL
ncbi:Xaa-Pro peptidase family protein [uncultured Roseovarius sp.]|uniref:M24 family metallopeptidase n=1 Tax=uncultured Roseovarius sp. TaxID=293344 RepID=UPI0026374F09|nr:Xaa-Pro peptidase family protein [uncultured Roseovarius sp.]